jgi:hypothetical protein
MTIADDAELTIDPIPKLDRVTVARTPWGCDDEIGRLNLISPETQRAFREQLDGIALAG